MMKFKFIRKENIMIINWYKFDPKAKIPTKRDEDAGFDIYTIEDNVILQPFEKRLFATGLGAAPTPGYWLMAMDRGSTGSRGIHTHCGIIDNGGAEVFNHVANLTNFFTARCCFIVFKLVGRYIKHATEVCNFWYINVIFIQFQGALCKVVKSNC